jgi:hypothetical protein
MLTLNRLSAESRLVGVIIVDNGGQAIQEGALRRAYPQASDTPPDVASTDGTGTDPAGHPARSGSLEKA